jgi:hypothetical protein
MNPDNFSQFSLDLNTKVFTFVNFLSALILYIFWAYFEFGLHFWSYGYSPPEAIAFYHFGELSILILALFLISLYNLIYAYFENLKYRILASIFVTLFFIFVIIKLITAIRDIYIGNIHTLVIVDKDGIRHIENIRADIFTDSMYYNSVIFLFAIFSIFIIFLARSFSEKYKKNFIKENTIFLFSITLVALVSTILTVEPIIIPDIFNYYSYIIIFIPFYNSLILFFKYFNKEKLSIIFSMLAFYPVLIFTFHILILNLIAGKGSCYYGLCNFTMYGSIETWFNIGIGFLHYKLEAAIAISIMIIIAKYLPVMVRKGLHEGAYPRIILIMEKLTYYIPIIISIAVATMLFKYICSISSSISLVSILYLFFRKRIPFLIMMLLLNLSLIYYYYFVYLSVGVKIIIDKIPPFSEYRYNTKPMLEFLGFFNIFIVILILINLAFLFLGMSYKQQKPHV